MTDCARASGMLAQFVDGDLAVEQAAWLEVHLAACAECSGALERFGEIDRSLVAWGESLGRRNPAPAVREQLEARMVPPHARGQWIRWLPVAAAAIAAAFALVTATPPRKPAAVATGETPFIRIPYLAAPDPQENTTIVRMDIRVSTLIAVGYRVAADPEKIVPAEVLVGEDGRAHAVRVLSDLDWNGAGD